MASSLFMTFSCLLLGDRLTAEPETGGLRKLTSVGGEQIHFTAFTVYASANVSFCPCMN